MRSIDHTPGPRCVLCDVRLKISTHVMLVAWFYYIKKKYPFLHLWDDPQYLTIRLFQIDQDGNDRICEKFMQKIVKELKEDKITDIKNRKINEFYYEPRINREKKV